MDNTIGYTNVCLSIFNRNFIEIFLCIYLFIMHLCISCILQHCFSAYVYIFCICCLFLKLAYIAFCFFLLEHLQIVLLLASCFAFACLLQHLQLLLLLIFLFWHLYLPCFLLLL